MRRLAFTRFEILEPIVEQNPTAFIVCDDLDVVCDVSSYKSCELENLNKNIFPFDEVSSSHRQDQTQLQVSDRDLEAKLLFLGLGRTLFLRCIFD